MMHSKLSEEDLKKVLYFLPNQAQSIKHFFTVFMYLVTQALEINFGRNEDFKKRMDKG